MEFNLIEQGPHGDTVYCSDPKIRAYKAKAHAMIFMGRNSNLVCHSDGAYTVKTDGCSEITYQKGGMK